MLSNWLFHIKLLSKNTITPLNNNLIYLFFSRDDLVSVDHWTVNTPSQIRLSLNDIDETRKPVTNVAMHRKVRVGLIALAIRWFKEGRNVIPV
jgi:hypothetical protein